MMLEHLTIVLFHLVKSLKFNGTFSGATIVPLWKRRTKLVLSKVQIPRFARCRC